LGSDVLYCIQKKGADVMKLYNVFVYNYVESFIDIYMVRADDPVDARNVAVQRLIDETGAGLDAWEIVDVIEVKEGV
jgi:hypothetical protein